MNKNRATYGQSVTDGSRATDNANTDDFLARIAREMDAETGGQLVHIEHLAAQPPRYSHPNPALPAALQDALAFLDIKELYAHQVESLQRVRQGEHVVVVTPTSSGKTLCYNLPILETMLQDREARALYIYPINALVNDQHKSLFKMNLTFGRDALSIDRYTGSVSSAKRREIRARQPNILLTNPEMVHLSFLQWHKIWGELWRNLRFIVVDEIHTYRGVFGANMAYVFRRLLRIAEYYDASPQFICCSATIANPRELAENLTGRSFSVIDRDAAVKGSKHFVFWNPALIKGSEGNLRESYTEDSVRLLRHCLDNDYHTIVFARARRLTEQMLRMSQESDDTSDDQLPPQIMSYRAGYLAEERETIEAGLKSGEIRGVITTNALELGIDIGGLDAAIIAGYPGTIMSTWQQAGRAGRRGRDSVVFLVASQNPLDQYYMTHPEHFFAEPHEQAVVDLDNPFIQLKHLLCAAHELPWRRQEINELEPALQKVFARLTAFEMLSEEQLDGETCLVYPQDRKGVHMRVSLRSAGHETFRILDENRNEVGTIEPPNAFRETHPGAIYQHGDEDYRVLTLNRRQHTIHVRPESAPHYTRSQSLSSLKIEEPIASRSLGTSDSGLIAALGETLATETVRSYQEIEAGSNTLIRRVNLNYPLAMRLHTTAFWLSLPSEMESLLTGDSPQERQEQLSHGLHALQHLLNALLPLLVMCDRRDVDGFYHLNHPDIEGSAVFLYDAYEGGIGLAEAAYQHIEALLLLARDTVRRCNCREGCPSCIQISSCRYGNEQLSKRAAITLLDSLCRELNTEGTAHVTGTRHATTTGQHLDLSLERALIELDQETRKGRLADHIHDQPEKVVIKHFGKGDWIKHNLYGRGIVLESRIDDETEWVKVRFVRRGLVKRFDAGHNQIRKLS